MRIAAPSAAHSAAAHSPRCAPRCTRAPRHRWRRCGWRGTRERLAACARAATRHQRSRPRGSPVARGGAGRDEHHVHLCARLRVTIRAATRRAARNTHRLGLPLHTAPRTPSSGTMRCGSSRLGRSAFCAAAACQHGSAVATAGLCALSGAHRARVLGGHAANGGPVRRAAHQQPAGGGRRRRGRRRLGHREGRRTRSVSC